jgi:8-amino-7-oxononanoate synthase
VVCDGIYPEGGDAAPLVEFASLAGRASAVLYVDDSHGLGVFGEGPRTPASPYGRGGGGLLKQFDLLPARIVLAGTLAKALGIPVAFVAGPASFIGYVRRTSQTLVHSSPPSMPNVAAAIEAIRIHEAEGEERRLRLAKLVRRFQDSLRYERIEFKSNGLFPIQTIPLRSVAETLRVGGFLRGHGIWPVLQLHPPDHPRGGTAVLYNSIAHGLGRGASR